MKLTVVIVNYNGGEFLPHCLSSIRERMWGVRYEVCVVDNASTDGSPDLVAEQFPEVALVRNEANLGFAAGVNVGLRRAAGEYVLWLNPDSVVMDDGIEALLGYMDAHPEAGVVGPKIIDTGGGVQLSCRSFPSFRTALFNRYSLLTRLFPRNRFSDDYLMSRWGHDSVREVDWVSGACLLHRRDVAETAGALDERFFMYSEDVDFCLRARRAGWAVVYHPGWRVLHHIGGSSRQAASRMIVERHRSMWRYYVKHFRRNAFQDTLVASCIYARCGLILARQKILAGARRIRPRPYRAEPRPTH